jgi:hypothetical protein
MKTGTKSLLAVTFVCAAAIAQESQIAVPTTGKPHTLSSGKRTFPNGIHFDNRIMAEDMADTSWIPKFMGGRQTFGEWDTWDGNVYHHFFFIGQRYLGYDLEADPVPGTDRIRLTFQPLSVDWTGEEMKVPVAQPALPPPQVIDDGEELVMDLAIDPVKGEKITEHMSFHVGTPGPPQQPHDLTFDEAAMHLSSPSLFKHGQLIGESPLGTVAPIFAIHLPEGGWIYLSFKPHDGYNFEKAGVIHSARAEFTIGGHDYEVRSRSLIAQRPELNLYVLLDQHEPAGRGLVVYSPAPFAKLSKNYLEIRAGSVEQMLPKP